MAPTKHFSSTAPHAPKRPRLLRLPEEDGETDKSEMFYRPLTTVPARTQSSQSTIATQITWKGLLGSSETPSGRNSPWGVEFHLLKDHTDNFEAQEKPEAIQVPEMEEIVDTSQSDHDDAPENDNKSSEEDKDEPENEPQAPSPSSTQRSQTVGK
ncbi:uncharacterized protein H6S33_011681 [Morchella sextelata]|uniref:uncharacterized protein n=1 Tax=Morchella sextelata TaxID=1174677 RepID=UPI001D0503E4|nr:uncharacterized protein H6S33_011681 [Morchella sextelata]KAH0611254.1 hypothetical protein H6S33_011681 [Morchella sextelata]